MNPDRLEELLEELPAPDSTDARERAVSAARAQVAARGPAVRSRRRSPRRAAGAVLAVAVLAGGLLTPPGRAASGWVGALVGIGEVGGSPTAEKRGFPETSPPVVVNNGRAPDGSRYEWVAFGCKVDLHDEGLPTRFTGFGLSLEWPGVKGAEGGGVCEGKEDRPAPRTFSSLGVHILPSQFHGVKAPDLFVSGSTGPDVHRVRVIYRDPAGKPRELPVDFARADGELMRRARLPEPLGTFVAFIPGAWAARDEVESRLDLRALETTGELKLGPIARRERAAVQRAHRTCAPKQPDLTGVGEPNDREAVDRAFRPFRECVDRLLPPSPLEYVAYDEHGKVLGRMKEPAGMQAISSRRAVTRLTKVPERARRGKRPIDPGATGRPVVLISGRAPDGAHYELFAQRFEEDGKVFGICQSLWWPRVPQAHSGGFCGPGLPGKTAFGRRHPERVAAKPFGFLESASPATRYILLQGFARAQVARVRVQYKDPDGEWRDASVKLAHVGGRLRREAGGDEDFGYWVSFLPGSVARYYGGIPPRRAEGPAAVRVIAYGADGGELSRYDHRN